MVKFVPLSPHFINFTNFFFFRWLDFKSKFSLPISERVCLLSNCRLDVWTTRFYTHTHIFSSTKLSRFYYIYLLKLDVFFHFRSLFLFISILFYKIKNVWTRLTSFIIVTVLWHINIVYLFILFTVFIIFSILPLWPLWDNISWVLRVL